MSLCGLVTLWLRMSLGGWGRRGWGRTSGPAGPSVVELGTAGGPIGRREVRRSDERSSGWGWLRSGFVVGQVFVWEVVEVEGRSCRGGVWKGEAGRVCCGCAARGPVIGLGVMLGRGGVWRLIVGGVRVVWRCGGEAWVFLVVGRECFNTPDGGAGLSAGSVGVRFDGEESMGSWRGGEGARGWWGVGVVLRSESGCGGEGGGGGWCPWDG